MNRCICTYTTVQKFRVIRQFSVFHENSNFYSSNENKMNIKSSPDVEEVINNDVYCRYLCSSSCGLK